MVVSNERVIKEVIRLFEKQGISEGKGLDVRLHLEHIYNQEGLISTVEKECITNNVHKQLKSRMH